MPIAPPTIATALTADKGLIEGRFAPVRGGPSGRSGARARQKGKSMLWTIFVILLILWLLGMVTSNTMGGFIHILLVVAIVVVLIRVIQGRNPV
jgi:hypothetical protein